MDAQTVSVVIPCYNGAAFLEPAIQSVLAQTHRPAEVLVVDDGSTDGSGDLAARFDHPVRVIRQRNAGVAAARNRGVAEARGAWVAFLDGDDLWRPEKLQRQLECAARGFELVYTDAQNIGEVGSYPHTRQAFMDLLEGDVFEPLLLGNFIVTSSVLVRRSVVLEADGFASHLPPCEDWRLWLQIAQHHTVGVVREPLTQYRLHEGGISRDIERMHRCRLSVLDEAADLPRARLLSSRRWARALAEVWTATGGQYEVHGQPRQALHCYLRALKLQPARWTRWKHVLRAAAVWCAGRVGGITAGTRITRMSTN